MEGNEAPPDAPEDIFMENIPPLLPLPPEDAMSMHIVPPPLLPPENIIPNELII